MFTEYISKNNLWHRKYLVYISVFFILATVSLFGESGLYINHSERAIDKYAMKPILDNLSIEEKAAQVLMVNIAGSREVTVHDIQYFKSTIPGAIILFGYNIAKTPQQVYSFLESCTKSFHNIAEKEHRHFVPPLYATDNEGGQVYRTRSITIALPAPEYIGKHYSRNQAYQWYYALGRQMLQLGFHLNLAPVAEPKAADSVLKGRCYSSEHTIAAEYASTVVNAMQNAGLLAAVKHFPGSGNADLHKSSAELQATYEQLKNYHCYAFSECIKHDTAVMLVSHVTVPVIENVPFCFSKKGIQWLRTELGFNGLILTDDIIMQALKQHGETPAANAIRALKAGCDMIMCTLQNIYPIIESIASSARNDSTLLDRLNNAVLNILWVKYRIGLIDISGNYIEKHPDWEEFKMINDKNHEKPFFP